MEDNLKRNLVAWYVNNPSEKDFWEKIVSNNRIQIEDLSFRFSVILDSFFKADFSENRGPEKELALSFYTVEGKRLEGVLSLSYLEKESRISYFYFNRKHKNLFLNLKISSRLHSKYNPAREAEQYSKEGVPVLLGCGLGYALKNILSETKTPVILIESNVLLLLLLFLLADFSKELEEGRLRIIYKADEDFILEQSKNLQSPNFHFIPHRGCIQAFGVDVYNKAKEKFWNVIEKKGVNQATLSKFEKIWAKNIVRNIKRIDDFIPLKELLAFVKEKNFQYAFLVGAGPSLTRENRELLDAIKQDERLRKQILLVCADTALKPLLAAGLDPDIIFVVDPQPVNRLYLQAYNGKAVLCTETLSDYFSLKEFLTYSRNMQRSKICLWNTAFPLFELFCKEYLGTLAFGGSVTTNAFDFILQSEIKNIYLLGQDLAFTGGLAHTSGAMIEEKIKRAVHRLNSFENYNYKQLHSLPVREALTYKGSLSKTNDKLLIFRDWFVSRLRRLDDAERKMRKFYIVGKDSLVINGFEALDAKDVRNTFDSQTTKADSFYFESDRILYKNFGISKLLQNTQLWQNIKALEKYKEYLEQAVEINGKLLSRSNKNASFVPDRQLLTKLDAIDEKLKKQKELNSLLGMLMQNTIFQITEGFDKTAVSKKNTQTEILQRSLNLYTALKEAAAYHLHLLKRIFL